MLENTEVARKRILYAITKSNWGGAQRYVCDMAQAAQAAGHDVLVVTGSEGPLTQRLKAADIRTHAISAMQRDVKLMAEIHSFRELMDVMREFRPDVVHGNSSKAGALAGLAARLLRVPRIVFTAHAWAFNERRPKWQKAIIAIFHYITVLLSHTTICVSRATQIDAAWMPFVQKRFVVIHNGVAPVELHTREHARARLAPDFSTFPDALWIGTVAELHPTKGLDTLIEAFSDIARDLPVVLLIIGEGTEWSKLQKLTKIYDLPDRIMLAGFVPEAASYLRALDIFALPSRSEALGYAFLEAGIAHLPATGTRVGGVPEVIEDGETGILVPSDDRVALAEALRALVANEALRAKLAQNLHALVLKKFSISEMTKKTLALY